MAIITIAEARAYAHDNESTDLEMQGYIDAATAYIASGIGTVNESDARVKLLAKLLVCDFDDVRVLTGSEANSTRHLIRSLKLQLRTEASSVFNSNTEEAGGADGSS